jgi:hypothetical protein
VLIWLVVSLSQGATSMDGPYGVDTPARRILGCVYGAILLASVAGLGIWQWGSAERFVTFTLTLFSLQIAYKVLTAVAIGPGHRGEPGHQQLARGVHHRAPAPLRMNAAQP